MIRTAATALMISAIIAIGILQAAASSAYADEPVWGGTALVGWTSYSWDPDFQASEQDRIISFKTEGAKLYRVQGDLTLDQEALFIFAVERPVASTTNQEELVKSTTTTETGLEKFTYGITPKPFAERLFPENTFSAKAMRVAMSLRYKAVREVFFGTATAEKDLAYLTPNSVIDYTNKTVSGAQIFPAGQNVSFKTTFADDEVTVALFSFSGYHLRFDGKEEKSKADTDLRIGMYTSTWERPTATAGFKVSGNPIIFDAKYKSQGVIVSVETTDPGIPGLNIDFTFRLGYNDTYSGPLDWNKAIQTSSNETVDVGSAALDMNFWYNYYFGNRAKGWGLTAGASYNFRAMNVDVNSTTTQSGGNTTTTTKRVIHDSDAITKYYLMLACRF